MDWSILGISVGLMQIIKERKKQDGDESNHVNHSHRHLFNFDNISNNCFERNRIFTVLFLVGFHALIYFCISKMIENH